jgi:hypothetical protein
VLCGGGTPRPSALITLAGSGWTQNSDCPVPCVEEADIGLVFFFWCGFETVEVVELWLINEESLDPLLDLENWLCHAWLSLKLIVNLFDFETRNHLKITAISWSNSVFV